jgi:hypothetical protein
MANDWVSISEFLSLTQMGEHELLKMLERGHLKTCSAESGELRISLEGLTPESLAARPDTRTAENADHDALLEETVASELVAALDEMIDEALALAFRWNGEAHTDEYPEK